MPFVADPDNLLPDIQYITGFGDGGVTNQFMAMANLLYISLLASDHIPILPPFVSESTDISILRLRG